MATTRVRIQNRPLSETVEHGSSQGWVHLSFDEVVGWVETKPTVATELTALARTAVERIVRKSELKDLWDESDSAEAWWDAMTNLRKRLE
jgi:hypothetical protein